jgi:exonuclease SbcD
MVRVPPSTPATARVATQVRIPPAIRIPSAVRIPSAIWVPSGVATVPVTPVRVVPVRIVSLPESGAVGPAVGVTQASLAGTLATTVRAVAVGTIAVRVAVGSVTVRLAATGVVTVGLATVRPVAIPTPTVPCAGVPVLAVPILATVGGVAARLFVAGRGSGPWLGSPQVAAAPVVRTVRVLGTPAVRTVRVLGAAPPSRAVVVGRRCRHRRPVPGPARCAVDGGNWVVAGAGHRAAGQGHGRRRLRAWPGAGGQREGLCPLVVVLVVRVLVFDLPGSAHARPAEDGLSAHHRPHGQLRRSRRQAVARVVVEPVVVIAVTGPPASPVTVVTLVDDQAVAEQTAAHDDDADDQEYEEPPTGAALPGRDDIGTGHPPRMSCRLAGCLLLVSVPRVTSLPLPLARASRRFLSGCRARVRADGREGHVRLLLFSDLHLERGFAGLRDGVRQARRDALRECLLRIAALAASLQVDALCCGGDLFEQERHRPDTANLLREAFAALHPLPVYLAPGNHDWLAPESLYLRTSWSPNVHLFTEARLTAVELAAGLTLWGAAHHSPTNTPGFLDEFRVDRGGVHLALFHGAEQGAVTVQEMARLRHAPFRAEQIQRSGLHYAMLGHFHTPRDAPDHVYPGNPEPLTFGETGVRGPVELTIDDAGRVSTRWHPVAVTQVHDVPVDLTGVTHAGQVQDRVDAALAEIKGIVRVVLRGEVDQDVEVDVRRLERPGHLDDWVVQAAAVRYGFDLDALAAEQTVRGAFVRAVRADPELDEPRRHRVLLTGLRAFAGRDDLEVG